VPGVEHAQRESRSRAALVEQAWIWSVVGYTVLRFVVAWGAFGEHGANVWIFGLLDVGTAWPYAKAVAVICRRSAAFEWRGLPLPIMVALASFFAPYAYLWLAAGEMPDSLRAGLALFVTILFGAAVIGVVSKARKLRAAHAPEIAPEIAGLDDVFVWQAPSQDTAVAVDDIVIDLRFGEARMERASDVAPAEPVADLT
jgi:hypothetical protein